MKVDIGSIITIIAGLVTWFKSKQKTWDYLVKILTPLITEAEQMTKDGIIDKSERKELVMMAVKQLEKDGKIKLNFITRWMVKIVVNKIAEKLPDIKISIEAKKILENEKHKTTKTSTQNEK